MSAPQQVPAPPSNPMRTVTLWVSIAALIVAAIMGGIFIIIGDQANVAGRSWLTFLLVLAFAGAVTIDANVSNSHRYLFASTITNVVILAIGLVKLWNGPGQPPNTDSAFVWNDQFGRWLGVLLVLRIAMGITQLYFRVFVTRARLMATKASGLATIVLVWITGAVLAIPLSFPYINFGRGWPDWWWRLAGAAALVMAVCIVVPVVVRAFEPKRPLPQGPQHYPVYAAVPGRPPVPTYPVTPGYPVAAPPAQGYPAGPQGQPQPVPPQPVPAQQAPPTPPPAAPSAPGQIHQGQPQGQQPPAPPQ